MAAPIKAILKSSKPDNFPELEIFYSTHSPCWASDLIHPVGLVVLNQVVLILNLHLVLQPDQSIKSWNFVQVLNQVFTVAVLLRNSQL